MGKNIMMFPAHHPLALGQPIAVKANRLAAINQKLQNRDPSKISFHNWSAQRRGPGRTPGHPPGPGLQKAPYKLPPFGGGGGGGAGGLVGGGGDGDGAGGGGIPAPVCPPPSVPQQTGLEFGDTTVYCKNPVGYVTPLPGGPLQCPPGYSMVIMSDGSIQCFPVGSWPYNPYKIGVGRWPSDADLDANKYRYIDISTNW